MSIFCQPSSVGVSPTHPGYGCLPPPLLSSLPGYFSDPPKLTTSVSPRGSNEQRPISHKLSTAGPGGQAPGSPGCCFPSHVRSLPVPGSPRQPPQAPVANTGRDHQESGMVHANCPGDAKLSHTQRTERPMHFSV